MRCSRQQACSELREASSTRMQAHLDKASAHLATLPSDELDAVRKTMGRPGGLQDPSQPQQSPETQRALLRIRN